MENNVQGNETKSQNPAGQGSTRCDWREERRAWRREMKEHRHQFPFRGLFWGLVLVLLGTLFLLNQTGAITGDAWWQSLLVGLGAIMIINGITHYYSPGYRWGSYGKFLAGIVLIIVGALFLIGVSEWWSVVLIVAGIAFLLRFIWRRQDVSS
jgi:uncharacterized membrane protein HdeD (DUF308 family)